MLKSPASNKRLFYNMFASGNNPRLTS